MKRAEKRRRNPVPIALHLLLALALVLSLASVPLSGFLDLHLSHLKSAKTLKEDFASTALLSEQTVEEGAVLLENADNALPLAADRSVCLFGMAAVQAVQSDGRTGGQALTDGLTQAGFQVNEGLLSFYKEQKTYTGEIAASEYDAELLSEARNSANIAVIALSHTEEEGPLLTENEASLLQLVADLDFEKTIVLINSPCVMQLDFLQNEAYGIDGALWIGAPGEGGFAAVGKLLSGAVTPSGKTAATYVYDLNSAPAVGTAEATATDGNAAKSTASVSYTEGIYVGYRYYETRYADDEKDYQTAVQYPMGYGLSYTSFEEKITGFAFDGLHAVMKVKVTNTGAVSGAQVVQLYARLPVTKSGLEKSAKVLVGYGRTKTLEPGKSDTVELSFAVEDMASFNEEKSCYTLEKGTYELELSTDAHTVVEKRALKISQKYNYHKTTTELALAAPEAQLTSTGWKTVEVAEPAGAEAKAAVAVSNANGEQEGGKTRVRLAQLAGAAYDDEAWEELLDALSSEQLTALTGFDGAAIPAIRGIGLAQARFLDGERGVIGKALGVRYKGTLLPCLSLMGCTWDTELIGQLGAAEGQEAADMGLMGLYSPSPMLLRNGWYGDAWSEDSLLTGTLLGSYAAGVQSSGPMCVLRTVGPEETEGTTVRVGEQALRELYLKSVYPALTTGALGVLSTECLSETGVQSLLRTEWGFEGAILGGTGAGESQRDAAHHILYALANAATNPKAGPASGWRLILALADVILLALNLLVLTMQGKLRRARGKDKREK